MPIAGSQTPDGLASALGLSSSGSGQTPSPKSAGKASVAANATSATEVSPRSASAAVTDSSTFSRELLQARSMLPTHVQPPAPDAANAASPPTDRKNGIRAAASNSELAPPPASDTNPVEPTTGPIAFSPDPAVTTVAAAGAAHPTGPASPVEQVAPVLLTLAKTQDGNQQMTVRLHPDDLGMVQVRIERGPSGSTQVEITADKTNTLQALQRDQVRLHHTLDDAGIPSAGRTVTFHITQPVHAPAAAATSAGTSQGGAHSPQGSRANNGTVDAGGSGGGGRSSYTARESRSWSGGRPVDGSAAAALTQASDRSGRVGLDITA